MVEMLADYGFCLIVPIGLIIVFIVIKFQKPSPPSTEEQSIDFQSKEIDGMLGIYPNLKDSFVEAKGDGATHAVYFRNQDVIKFYRTVEGELEFRNLVFIPAPRWYWGSDWGKCDEIPHYAIQVSDKL